MDRDAPNPPLEIRIADDPPLVLHAERLRDGRLAIGTRRGRRDGEWEAGELHLLEPVAFLDLAGWLAGPVEEAWTEVIRDRRDAPLRTASELYGPGADGVQRLAEEMLRQVPPALLARGMILLANAIGPESRSRLVRRLNRTENVSEEQALRRRMAEESEAFAYAVAAAALYDALAAGVGSDLEDPAAP